MYGAYLVATTGLPCIEITVSPCLAYRSIAIGLPTSNFGVTGFMQRSALADIMRLVIGVRNFDRLSRGFTICWVRGAAVLV